MAEAVKPTTTKSLKASTSSHNSPQTISHNSTEITDKNLETRLKSLTSFINNIEPKPKTSEESNLPTAPPQVNAEKTEIPIKGMNQFFSKFFSNFQNFLKF